MIDWRSMLRKKSARNQHIEAYTDTWHAYCGRCLVADLVHAVRTACGAGRARIVLYYAHSVPLAAQAPHRRVLDDPGPPGEAGAKNAVAQPMSGAERRTEAPRAACGGWAEAASQRPFLSRSFCAYSSMSYD